MELRTTKPVAVNIKHEIRAENMALANEYKISPNMLLYIYNCENMSAFA